ncbi:LytTR family DNA-binding domain-containing protein [Roseobacter sinensis]|uniref:LytTR family transcriptional regulator n=1 Tax=Roseobacter sinensis TaxID=2931391 RepID=A0ABT3BF37_9RHOB|nr:LytTR family DNA-binding domain-containing protein [Roseobacter sp. WL0113]MCV3272193.1 LytTR family transcriptional regulator [Roseobacter sp. WL0113]
MADLAQLKKLDPRTSWTGFLLASGAVLTVVFILLEPGPSRGLPKAKVVLFWLAHVVGALICLQAAQLALQRSTWVRRWPPVPQVFVGGLTGSILFAPLALGLDWLLGVAVLTDDAREPFGAALVGELAALTPVVTITWLALNATRLLRLPAPAVMARPAAGFWAKVPPHLGRDLVALSAELHYLRVYTVRGEALILYGFGKAIAEADQGVQIHRSHWVALAHVERIGREGREGVCHLAGGLRLPISRRFRRAMEERAAGAT